MESDPPFDPKAWNRLGSELGVLGLSVSEADGGVGGTLVDQAVAVEELGTALACGPLFGTVFLAIPALVAASAGPGCARRIARRADRGSSDRRVRDLRQGGAPSTRRRCRSPRRVLGDAWTLTGTVERVVDAGAADDLLVAAVGPGGVSLYVVDAAGPCVTRTPLLTVDLHAAAGNRHASRRAGPSGRRTR